ncbi:hypothetical protein NliqN6_4462 [Naganishia liquefaciens]|uniref:Uncharacterized protein n=1 Tax=Naganishia liquefaciens TaxID=104408 RepID=A0A8H3YFT1_9TREE|nr:hypothetical protein NliqN6_4462 [Naganishia liquefaciens]
MSNTSSSDNRINYESETEGMPLPKLRKKKTRDDVFKAKSAHMLSELKPAGSKQTLEFPWTQVFAGIKRRQPDSDDVDQKDPNFAFECISAHDAKSQRGRTESSRTVSDTRHNADGKKAQSDGVGTIESGFQTRSTLKGPPEGAQRCDQVSLENPASEEATLSTQETIDAVNQWLDTLRISGKAFSDSSPESIP